MQDENTRTQAYVEMPKVRLEKLIIPYKKYIKDFAMYDSKLPDYEKSALSNFVLSELSDSLSPFDSSSPDSLGA